MNQSHAVGSMQSIDLASIRQSRTNPRKSYDYDALAELTRSIEEMGVTVPVLVRPMLPWSIEVVDGNPAGKFRVFQTNEHGDMVASVLTASRDEASHAAASRNEADGWYELVTGGRRYRAALAAGLDEIPAQVRTLTDAEAREIQLVENLNRADLHPMEEAQGYAAMILDGADAERIAKLTGKPLSYVKPRLALLTLGPTAASIFAERHLLLDHALLLATLTEAQQLNALLYLVGLRDWAIDKKEPLPLVITRRLHERIHTANHSHTDPVSATPGQLKNWIQSHVLLQLAGVPWDLADETLVPIAGPCTTCPKRTGANVALFAELTTDGDNCTDPICYSAKQQAQVQREQDSAKTKGSPLLRLSTKKSADLLAAPVIEMRRIGVAPPEKAGGPAADIVKAVVVAKKVVKAGQWVESAEGACPSTVQGVYTDGEATGTTRFVCPDQACRVHRHHVAPTREMTYGVQPPTKPGAKHNAAREEQELRESIQNAVAAEVKAQTLAAAMPSHRFLERYLANAMNYQNGAPEKAICRELGLTVKGAPKDKPWSWQDKSEASKVIGKYLLETATLPELQSVAAIALVDDVTEESDDALFELAEVVGVDHAAIHARMLAEARAKRDAKNVADSVLAERAARPTKPTKASKSSAPSALDSKSRAAGERDEETSDEQDDEVED